jgi:hypothetical protein
LGFSGANLATVAYAEVSADGTSLKANSGVATKHADTSAKRSCEDDALIPM